MKAKKLFPWIVVALVISGCVPERYQWSPDGKWMTVLTDKGLYLANSNGGLQSSNVPGAFLVDWFGDSKRILIARDIEAAHWDDLNQYLTPEQIRSVTAISEHARPAILDYDWSKGAAWQNFETDFIKQEKAAGRDTKVLTDLDGAVAVYLRDHDDGALHAKLPPARWNDLTSATQSFYCVKVYAVDETGFTAGPQLMISLKKPNELRVSPTGAAAAIVVPMEDDSQHNGLWVASTDGDRPAVLISDSAAWYPDWTSDGKYVVYARAVENAEKAPIGTISRTLVAQQSGQLLAQPGNREDLAGILYNDMTRVRCLKDGRIVFNSAEMTLPATPSDAPQKGELFAIFPGKMETIGRVLSRSDAEQCGDSSQFFEFSPDGQRVSIPDRTGTVDVVDLATGTRTRVQDKQFPKNPNSDFVLPTVPSWRNNDELTFAAPGDKGRPQVILYSVSKQSGTVLSDTWPAQMVNDLVSH